MSRRLRSGALGPKIHLRWRRHVRLLVFLLVTGCPHGGDAQDLTSLPALTTDDPRAEAHLREAREAAEEGRTTEAEEGYRTFLRTYPNDSLLPLARLGLGRILLADGRVDEALERFDEVAAAPDANVAEAGRFHRGIALHLAGRSEEAVEILSPMLGRTIDPEDTSLLLSSLASAAVRTGRLSLALDVLDRTARAEDLPQAEREAASARIRALVEEAEAEPLRRAYGALSRSGSAWPVVAEQEIRRAFAVGDMTRVAEVVAELRERELVLSDELAQLAARAERTANADPRVIGAIVPLTGRARAVGQRAVRGLMLAAGVPSDGPPDPDAPQLILRDDGGDPERAVRAVDELVTVHRAIAIIGPLEGRTAQAAARRAQELGVPIITLVPEVGITEAGPMVFRLFTSPADEASVLVDAARARGARRFAILFPTHAYGRAMRAAFEARVQAVGGELVAAEGYAPDATSFRDPVARVAAARPDAVFVPDSARRLGLIAPALGTGGLWSTRPGGSAPRGATAVTLLAPSVAADARALRSSERYLQGALFAALFDAGSATGEGRRFVEAFSERHEEAPDAFAAYAYDAVRAVRRGVTAGATTRPDLARSLGSGRALDTAGASGGLGPSRGPRSPARVLELTGEGFVPFGPSSPRPRAAARVLRPAPARLR